MYSLGRMGAQKCSDVKGNLEKVEMTLVCRRCLGNMKDDDLVEKGVKW
jgi:hypothetical protein